MGGNEGGLGWESRWAVIRVCLLCVQYRLLTSSPNVLGVSDVCFGLARDIEYVVCPGHMGFGC